MSKQLLNESDKNSIMLYFDINEKIKKLEEIFESIEYISPTPLEYKIIITDNKINELSLDKYNVMSSLHYLFISINECLPIFRINVDKKIKIESFDKKIENNKLIISIKESDPLKTFNEKVKSLYRQNFLDILLKRIYYKYNYYNAKIHYINNLKKKIINQLKYYYLYSLREKEKEEKMKKIYYKKYLDILRHLNKEKQIAKTI